MDLVERVVFFTIGGGIGFILGYMAARLRTIEQKVDEVQNEVHEVDTIIKHERDDRGALRLPSFSSIALAIVVMITAFAAFSASSANRGLAEANGDLENTVQCLVAFNEQQNRALTARDEAIKTSTDSEVALWTLYESLYGEASGLDPEAERLEELQERLFLEIVKYRDGLIETQEVRDDYEYGEPDSIRDCKIEEEQNE